MKAIILFSIISLVSFFIHNDPVYSLTYDELIMENADGDFVYQGLIGNPLVFKQKIINDDSEPKTLEFEFYTKLPNDKTVDKKIITATFDVNENRTITYQFVPTKEGNFITSVFNENLPYGSSVTFSVLDGAKKYHTENVVIKSNPDEKGCTRICVNPSDVTINVGDIVEWTNHDAGKTTIQTGIYRTGSQGTSFTFDGRFVGVIPQDGKFSFLFSEPGRYEYYFSEHRFLQRAGTIQVLPSLSSDEQDESILNEKIHEKPTPSFKSPLQQFKAESREKITCKSGLELLRKAINGHPACVKPQTKIELLKRGWGSTVWPFSSVNETKIDPEKYDAVIEGTVLFWMGQKGDPVRYQYEIQVDKYIKFEGEHAGQLTVLGSKERFTQDGAKAIFGLDYHQDADYWEIIDRELVKNEN